FHVEPPAFKIRENSTYEHLSFSGGLPFHPAASDWTFLYQLEQLLAERKHASPDSSYTASLYASGTKRIAQKVGEEGVETALAATVNDREELTNEASDLIYHLLVLLQDQDLDLSAVIGRLRERHQKKA
uniref:phosphoribosyl-ATP diphosphatase n=1 Tax=Serratia marcescens TaxID=615 RepID=UPI002022767F